MRTRFEQLISQNSQRLADLKRTAADIQRELMDARVEFEHQGPRGQGGHARAEHSRGHQLGAERSSDEQYHREQLRYEQYGPQQYGREPFGYGQLDHEYLGAPSRGRQQSGQERTVREPLRHGWSHGSPSPATFPDDFDISELDRHAGPDRDRTAGLVNRGRRSAYRKRFFRDRRVLLGAGGVLVLTLILVLVAIGNGASWPSSSLRVQSEVTKACQNPDVMSEPGQINFACAKSTRQILWVFALVTSKDNAAFADKQTGRLGLEPISSAQGSVLALSLNLHHPYDPFNPVDSLQVAARAINDIVGGATVTGTNGNIVVQPGLEGNPANCARYTGSAAIRSRKGFPSLCAEAVTSQSGQAALAADVYKKWYVGAPAAQVQDVSALFENATNPGSPAVQAVLKRLHE